tara:strand:+ start:2439 stop:3752 length:1314 start_codon:yes stop_codon:yes gene_type:complete
MLNENVRPSSIAGIKRLAKQIKKDQGIQHAAALDMAAKAASFENFKHARRSLSSQASLKASKHQLFITIYWRETKPYREGRETLQIDLSKPLLELCSKLELKIARGLGGRLVAPDHIVHDTVAQSQEFARGEICKAVRTLRFMEATGLRPSDDYRAAYPGRDLDNKLPNTDHATDWYDPANGQFVLVDEPYSPALVSEKRAEWARQHDWHLQASKWPGIYYPYNCSFFVATNASNGYDFVGLMKKIDSLEAPLVLEDWNGTSVPSHEVFASPMAKTPQDIRRARCKGTIIREASRTTTPYGAFGHERRKPTAKMPIPSHIEAGKIIKSVLASPYKPYSVNRRVDSVRSTLEDWMSSEIRRDELNGPEFFDVYYKDADETGPYAEAAKTSAGLIRILEELKAKLSEHYPECAPLRQQFGKIDTSIKIIRNHIEKRKAA